MSPKPESTMRSCVGIIGGSGLYDLPDLDNVTTLEIQSPWGAPSMPLKQGYIGKTRVVFIARHGQGHIIPPSEINYRANIDCMKRAGVTDLISVSACGSFRENLPPGSFTLVSQFVDFTKHRQASFFGRGCVAHVSMADPVSPLLAEKLKDAAHKIDIALHTDATYVAIEGPQFSTRAESQFYRQMGADVIGMTAMPEAKLAREAELTYALLAMVTDYDCWHETEADVDATSVLRVMANNSAQALKLLSQFAHDFPEHHEPCPVGSDRALDQALVTPKADRDPVLVSKLDAILARVLAAEEVK